MTETYKTIAVSPHAHRKAKIQALKEHKTLKKFIEGLIDKNATKWED